MITENVVRRAEEYVDSGAFFADLGAMVGCPTESARPQRHLAVKAYLDEILTPALTELGCPVAEYANPDPSGGPFLVGTRDESPELPTLLGHGHADEVDGHPFPLRGGLPSPSRTSTSTRPRPHPRPGSTPAPPQLIGPPPAPHPPPRPA
ncbi:hypothetical protein ACFY12_31765 [Streptomyces sp. NPDC001339]|uniref:hypothetical protein n=1 Tax=Streptomyces sp. NPDC001339 TaxID=3364563 RepID=UPI00368A4832